jgi:hypothetical protein
MRDHLPGNYQRLPAGRQHPARGPAAEQRLDRGGGPGQDLLAVVHHHQDGPVRGVVGQGVQRRAAWHLRDTQSGEHPVGDVGVLLRWVTDGCPGQLPGEAVDQLRRVLADYDREIPAAR